MFDDGFDFKVRWAARSLLIGLTLVGCQPTTSSVDDAVPGARADGVWVSSSRTTPARLMMVEPSHPLASRALLQSRDEGRIYTLDTEHGTVLTYDRDAGTVLTTEVGSEPASLTRVDDTLFVTLRADGRVARVANGMVTATADVGSEPLGIVARPDGDRLYVAVSQENVVLELDPETLEVLARIPTVAEPRFLALDPDGLTLYVASARGPGALQRIDLLSLVGRSFQFPETHRKGDRIPMVPRVTGELAIRRTDQGTVQLAVPTLYADTRTPIREFATLDEVIEVSIEPPLEAPPEVPDGYGRSSSSSSEPSTPDVVTIEASRMVGSAVVFDLNASRRTFDKRAVPLTVEYQRGDQVDRAGSYVTGVAFGPGNELVGALQATDQLVHVALSSEVRGDFDFSYADGGFVPRAGSVSLAPDAVRSVLWTTDDQVFAIGEHDHVLSEHQAASMRQRTQASVEWGLQARMAPNAAHVLAPVDLDPELVAGRRLFFDASDPAISAGEVSCSTCHYDGRDDGMTWRFESGPHQTPSLAGRVSDTAPVTWRSGVASVAEEARITAMGRMGGTGLDEAAAARLQLYIDSTTLPQPPTDIDPLAVSRGSQIFAAAGCGTCHSGQAYTDNNDHTFGRGRAVNTPRLEGIAATAPYLVDGRAGTLRDVLELAREPGAMGSTAHLSDAELDDLEAYLRTL